MKNLFVKRAALLVVFACACFAQALAKSTVYFFVDFQFWKNEYVVKVNGQEGFKLIPEVSKDVAGRKLYSMVARKVVFNEDDTYVLSCNCETNHGTMIAEINLNLEDGKTYYVIFNASMKNPFFAELLNEKEGEKILKKAQKNKKYTINEDIIF